MIQQIKQPRSARKSVGQMTYKQFLEWDGENQHVEWVDGEVIEMPPVSNWHQEIRGFLYVLLTHFNEHSELGCLLDDPFQMKTGPNLPGRAPDILFLSKRNLSRLKTNHLEGPADLVVEIISPGSGAVDRGDKFYEYEKGGVREYWLIDPARKQAEFYQRDRSGMFRLVQTDEQGIYRSAVMKGLWIKVSWLWQKPMPKVMAVLKEWKLD